MTERLIRPDGTVEREWQTNGRKDGEGLGQWPVDRFL